MAAKILEDPTIRLRAVYWVLTLSFVALVPLAFHLFVFVLTHISWEQEQLLSASGGTVTALLLIARTKILQRVYIFFHELSHWLAVLLFSGRVHEFKVEADLGYIRADKDHFLIRMAPYIFPFFPLVVLAILYLTLLLDRHQNWGLTPALQHLTVFFFSLSFVATWFYHFKLLWISTTDIAPGQFFLSISVIAAVFFGQCGALFYLTFQTTEVINRLYFL